MTAPTVETYQCCNKRVQECHRFAWNEQSKRPKEIGKLKPAALEQTARGDSNIVISRQGCLGLLVMCQMTLHRGPFEMTQTLFVRLSTSLFENGTNRTYSRLSRQLVEQPGTFRRCHCCCTGNKYPLNMGTHRVEGTKNCIFTAMFKL